MIHLIGLPHTQFDEVNYSSCAFTAKAVRTARMLRSKGHEVTVYWGGSMGDVSLLSVEEQEHFFGAWNPAQLPVVNWDAKLPYWQLFHNRARRFVDERIQGGDIVAFVGGSVSKEMMDHYFDRFIVIEPGIGYEGIVPRAFGCYESYAWMHHRYGAYGINDGRAFDTVIPNAVDPADWEVGDSGGYALFVGRLIGRKGPHVAAQIANAAGLRLVLAGGGVAERSVGRVVATDGTVVEGDVEHVGAVQGEERRRLFAGAEVFICPTLYIGPWEGVHAEAMMSGVGVVAPDYGVFTETLPADFRYSSLRGAVEVVGRARASRGVWWRDYAVDLCGIDVCANKYDSWVRHLLTLNGKGWYQ